MLSIEDTVSQIKAELKKRGSPEGIKGAKRFFKEDISCYGLTAEQTREVAKSFYSLVKDDFQFALKVGEKLFQSKVIEEASVAIDFLSKMRKQFTSEFFDIFDHWVDYLTNWATTDSFSLNIISEFVMLDSSKVKSLLEWTKSKNRWRRRAAAVSLIVPARRSLLLDEIFCVADQLMTDDDEMVQKGVGWLLKETSKKHPQKVHEYLLKWKDRTSALVLRYASEKLPENLKVSKMQRSP